MTTNQPVVTLQSLTTSHKPGKPTRTICWFYTCSPDLCTSYLRSIFQQPSSTQQSFRNQMLYLLQSIPSCSSVPSSFVHNTTTQTHKQDARHIVCGITTASMGFRSKITAHLIHFPRQCSSTFFLVTGDTHGMRHGGESRPLHHRWTR